ncbi:hypothetical protein PFICI_04246 [Pestalotiopsis fici W106-1]|uniref:Uncharacterized protein n=1 Tax=Pestalotiopsis fici (strain W106-1 / CGMCC3.15140) TaxID=1229662 RepID=W3X8K3_PESFW|nr:uncharacterized protein PFICI_04246 [Pestalotiopsis fici W106-1]ETS82370.1 hypothetical protein PFICI_04246 [Pestalotiopsis fici W106-1]
MAKYDKTTEGLTLVHDFAQEVKGKIFLLTGPSKGGIGAETVVTLAYGGPAMIILLGRSLSKIQPIIDSIKEINPDIKVKFVEIDLSSLRSTREAAQKILDDEEISHVNVVINNAAVMGPPWQQTEDGFELQLAAGHLGHFVLTNSIMPKILAAGAGARIVNVSSSGHRYNPFRFFDPNYTIPGSYNGFAAYGSVKTANILFSVALNRRLTPRGIHAYAIHPGSISTNLQEYMKVYGAEEAAIMEDGCWRVLGMSLATHRATGGWKTLAQGCATTLRAALDPDLVKEEGVYLEDNNLTTDTRLIKEWATDAELAEQCWKLSEDLVGQKFEI